MNNMKYKWHESHDLKKRFWLFEMPAYYPSGGLNDIKATINNIKELETALKSFEYYEDDEVIVFDSTTHKCASVGIRTGLNEYDEPYLLNFYCTMNSGQDTKECIRMLDRFFNSESKLKELE